MAQLRDVGWLKLAAQGSAEDGTARLVLSEKGAGRSSRLVLIVEVREVGIDSSTLRNLEVAFEEALWNLVRNLTGQEQRRML